MPHKMISVAASGSFVDLAVGKVKKVAGTGLELVVAGERWSARSGGLVKRSHQRTRGSDAFGPFEEVRMGYRHGRSNAATLCLRAYPEQAAACAFILYEQGQPPDPVDGLRVDFDRLPGFVRGHGSAIRFCWTHPFFVDDPGQVDRDTQFFLWEVKSGRMGCLVPLCGGGMRGWVRARDGLLGVNLSSHCTGHRPERVPVWAMGFGHDPYALVEKVYRAGMVAMGGPGRLRREKPFPRVFDYLGWCSWNACGHQVSHRGIVDVIDSFRSRDFPVRWVLVDDGWSPLRDRKLTGFDAHAPAFPRGLAGLVDDLKAAHGVTWVGAWHTFQGAWGGVDPTSALGQQYADVLLEGEGGTCIPQPVGHAGFRFFLDWHRHLRACGIDFVKVDNQSAMHAITKDRIPVFDAMRQQQYNLQASADLAFQNRLINCMAMTTEAAYCWLSSAVARCSDDYYPDREGNAQAHARDNAYNALWLSQLAVPDFDMFQSHHPQGEYHAVLRAVSGGPVYVTDSAGQQRWPVLRKLCFKDGLLLRADQPAAPARDVLFVDPAVEPVPLKVFTRAGEAGVVAAFNVRPDGAEVHGAVSPADAEFAGGHRFAAYEHFSGELIEVRERTAIDMTLGACGVKLYVFVPIHEGFAAIGLANKYLSPKAVLQQAQTPRGLSVVLREGGEFVAWIRRPPLAVRVDGKPLRADRWSVEANAFRAHIPDRRTSSEPVTVELILRR